MKVIWIMKNGFTGVVIGLLCIFANWFSNEITNYFTIFSLIVIKMILIISLLIYLIANLKKYKNFTLSALIFASFIFLLFYNFTLLKTKLELNLYNGKRNIIIDKIKDGEFQYYYDKNIILPIYKYVSSDGEVYVYRNDDEQVISFWILRGIYQSGSIELIYSSGNESLIYAVKNNSHISKMIKLKENWYYVISN